MKSLEIKFQVAGDLKERPNWSTKKGDMADIAKRPVSYEVTKYIIREKLTF